MKHYYNPYQHEYWEAQKQKDQVDNEISYLIIKVTAFLLAVGVVYLMFKK